ncbi:MAG: hypothetical protein ACE37F_31415 [Nannocystaceae bacterium]|nr:hypothetical protein [bacterium]
MFAAIVLSAGLAAASPIAAPEAGPPPRSQTTRTGRVMLGLLPLSFAAYGGVHTFGDGLRQGWIPCKTPRNPSVARGFEVVLCIGLPAKVELVAAGAPMTLAAFGTNVLVADALARGAKRWRRPAAIGAVVGGATLIAGGASAVIVSVVAEPPVLRSGQGWGWPFWTHVLVGQAGALAMAGGGALIGAGAAHLRHDAQRRVRVAPTAGPGFVVSGVF